MLDPEQLFILYSYSYEIAFQHMVLLADQMNTLNSKVDIFGVKIYVDFHYQIIIEFHQYQM